MAWDDTAEVNHETENVFENEDQYKNWYESCESKSINHWTTNKNYLRQDRYFFYHWCLTSLHKSFYYSKIFLKLHMEVSYSWLAWRARSLNGIFPPPLPPSFHVEEIYCRIVAIAITCERVHVQKRVMKHGSTKTKF